MKSKETCGLIPSGINQIDRAIGSLKCGELSVVASVPNYLSRDFAIKLATNIGIRNKTPMAVFSLELSSLQIVNWLIVNFSGMSREDLSKLSKDELDKMVIPLSESLMHIDDTVSITMTELETKIRRYACEHGIKLVIIDYLQLMDEVTGVRSECRQQAINNIISSLKRLAKELKLHIVVRNQLTKFTNNPEGLRWFCTFMCFLGPNSVLFKEADNLMMLFEEKSSNEVWAGLWNSRLNDIDTMKLDLLRNHK
jgi:replicative DNA helicase